MLPPGFNDILPPVPEGLVGLTVLNVEEVEDALEAEEDPDSTVVDLKMRFGVDANVEHVVFALWFFALSHLERVGSGSLVTLLDVLHRS